MLDTINTQKVLEAAETLARRICTLGGEHHGSAHIFDICMRAFDNKALPAEAITLAVHIAWPVDLPGEATIHRDGRLELRTCRPS